MSPRAVNVLLRMKITTKDGIKQAILTNRLEGAMNVGIGTLNEFRSVVGMKPLPVKSLQARINEAWREAAQLLLEVRDTHPKKRKLSQFLKKSEELDALVQDTKQK